jgi:hypothetical protein
MARRHGPLLPSLKSDRALVAEKVMRLETANSHQGQESLRQRPDRFVHPSPPRASKLAPRTPTKWCDDESVKCRGSSRLALRSAF